MGEKPGAPNVKRIGNDERAIALMERAKCGSLFRLRQHLAGTFRVPLTSSTNVRSSRRINRLVCAMAKFSRDSGSDFNRVRYFSYEARLSNAISPQAMLFVPSQGRKYPRRWPPHRGMMRPQFA